jgi:hypothetical protein
MAFADLLPPDDWRLLTELPTRVAAAATVADGQDAGGSTRAVVTAIESLLGNAKLLAHNALVQEVFAVYRHEGQGEAALLELSQNPPPGLVDRAIADAERARAVLDRLPNRGMTAEYAGWMLAVADEVVAASRTGGLLGLGGRTVTANEPALLGRLRAALVVPVEDEMVAQGGDGA